MLKIKSSTNNKNLGKVINQLNGKFNISQREWLIEKALELEKIISIITFQNFHHSTIYYYQMELELHWLLEKLDGLSSK